jgi:tetratricopeptide (TPR) repeat protein
MDRAVRLLQAHDLPAAIGAFQAMVDAEPIDAVALGNLGMALQLAQRVAEAESAYRRAIDAAPARPESRTNLATLLLSLGRRAEAAALLRQAIALSQNRPDARAQALMVRLVADMQAHPDDMAQPQADPVGELMRRGLACRSQGLGAAAIDCFHQVLAIDPAHGPAAYHAGNDCLWAGRLDEAWSDLGVALAWAVRERNQLSPLDPESSKRFNRAAARITLFDMLDALDAVQIPAFLAGGTALGCVREHDFISFDSDIDVGVMPGTDPAAVIEALDAHPGVTTLYHDVYRDAVIRVRCAGTGGVGGDVFLYQQTEDGLWCGVQRGPYALRWRDTPFDLMDTGFLGRTVRLPAPPERYLVENYGPGWATPDPDHIPGFSAPNLMEPRSLLIRCIIMRSIIAALARGDVRQSRRYCMEAVARFPDDAVLAASLAAIGTPA